MKEKDYILLIDKYLAGETSREENEMLQDWMTNPKNRKVFEEIRLIREEADPEDAFPLPSAEEELRKIHEQIAFTEIKETERRKHFTRAKTIKIAAAVLVLIGFNFLAWFLLGPQNETVVRLTTLNKYSEIRLPDSSRIFLSKNSSFSFEQQEDKRKGILEGKAYFEISEDFKKPFFILMEGATIKVLGTSFNVNTRGEGNVIEVVVTSGLVEFSSGPQKIKLAVGEKGVLEKQSNKIWKMENMDPNFDSWKTGELRFKQATMGVILKTLEGHYDVQIQVKDNSVLSNRFSGTFKRDSLNTVLQVLSFALDIDFQYKEGRYVVSEDRAQKEVDSTKTKL